MPWLYIAGAFAFGYAKARAFGVTAADAYTSASLFGDVASAAIEEAEFRLLAGNALEHFGASPTAANFGQATLFAALHSARTVSPVIRFADAFVGGLTYGRVFREYGFLGAVATHLAHNLGAEAGARS